MLEQQLEQAQVDNSDLVRMWLCDMRVNLMITITTITNQTSRLSEAVRDVKQTKKQLEQLESEACIRYGITLTDC